MRRLSVDCCKRLRVDVYRTPQERICHACSKRPPSLQALLDIPRTIRERLIDLAACIVATRVSLRSYILFLICILFFCCCEANARNPRIESMRDANCASVFCVGVPRWHWLRLSCARSYVFMGMHCMLTSFWSHASR
jgi:hypothetical protein